MATRYPLVIDTNDSNKIKELPDGDSLNLSGNDIINVINITASGTLTVTNLAVDTTNFTIQGQTLDGVAFSGNYLDLSNRPSLFSGDYNDLTNIPSLVTNTFELNDVSPTYPLDKQVLIYNNNNMRYEPAFIDQVSESFLSDLKNVGFINPVNNNLLKFNGSVWTNGTISWAEITDKAAVVEQGNLFTGDVKGSIFGDDSSFIVDGINNRITTNALQVNEINNNNQDVSIGNISATHILIQNTGNLVDFTGNVNFSNATVSGLTNVVAVPVPAGNDGEIQYNNNGVTGADSNFTWTSTSRFLSLSDLGTLRTNTVLGAVGNQLYLGSDNGAGTLTNHIALDSSSGVSTSFLSGTFTFGSLGNPVNVDFTNATVTGIIQTSIGNLEITNNTVDTADSSGIIFTPTVNFESDVIVENSLTINNDLRVNGNIISENSGTPEIFSDNEIYLSANTKVIITNSLFKLSTVDTTVRDNFIAENGDMVYNTDTNKFQGYANGVWVDLH